MVSRILLHSLDSAVTEDFVVEALHLWSPENDDAPQPALAATGAAPAVAAAVAAKPADWATARISTLEENEREHITLALQRAGGRISGPRGAAAGMVELKRRATGERFELPVDEALAKVRG